MDASDSVEAIKAGLWSATIDEFRIEFLRRFGQCTLIALQTLGQSVNLTPTPLAIHVQRRFMESLEANEADTVFPALHGTDPLNLPSIFAKGLLIGGRSGIPIRNGARYGHGVYVANMNAPSLAQGFVPSGQRLLVCAVLRSSEVTPHRDAQLVKNEAHVVPLFLASYEGHPLAAMLTLPAPVTIDSFSSRCSPPEFCQLPPVVLRWMGHSVVALIKAGFAISTLKRSGHSAASLRKAGCSIADLLNAGYSRKDVLSAGYPAADLRLAGYCVSALVDTNYEFKDLRAADYTAADLMNVGCSLSLLVDLGYSKADVDAACHACFWRSCELKSVMQEWWKKFGYKDRCDYDESAIESWRSEGISQLPCPPLRRLLSLTQAYFKLQHSQPRFDLWAWRLSWREEIRWREQWCELQRQEIAIAAEASSMRSPVHWPERDSTCWM